MNLRNYSHSYEIIKLKHFEMSFTLGMSIIDDVIQNFQTSLVEKWLRNSQVVIKISSACCRLYKYLLQLN